MASSSSQMEAGKEMGGGGGFTDIWNLNVGRALYSDIG